MIKVWVVMCGKGGWGPGWVRGLDSGRRYVSRRFRCVVAGKANGGRPSAARREGRPLGLPDLSVYTCNPAVSQRGGAAARRRARGRQRDRAGPAAVQPAARHVRRVFLGAGRRPTSRRFYWAKPYVAAFLGAALNRVGFPGRSPAAFLGAASPPPQEPLRDAQFAGGSMSSRPGRGRPRGAPAPDRVEPHPRVATAGTPRNVGRRGNPRCFGEILSNSLVLVESLQIPRCFGGTPDRDAP